MITSGSIWDGDFPARLQEPSSSSGLFYWARVYRSTVSQHTENQTAFLHCLTENKSTGYRLENKCSKSELIYLHCSNLSNQKLLFKYRKTSNITNPEVYELAEICFHLWAYKRLKKLESTKTYDPRNHTHRSEILCLKDEGRKTYNSALLSCNLLQGHRNG